jgi:hypothetical protein
MSLWRELGREREGAGGRLWRGPKGNKRQIRCSNHPPSPLFANSISCQRRSSIDLCSVSFARTRASKIPHSAAPPFLLSSLTHSLTLTQAHTQSDTHGKSDSWELESGRERGRERGREGERERKRERVGEFFHCLPDCKFTTHVLRLWVLPQVRLPRHLHVRRRLSPALRPLEWYLA